MTMNEIKVGDVLVRKDCKMTVTEVAEGEKGALRLTVYDPIYRGKHDQIVPAEKRTAQIPTGLVERS